MYKKPLFLFVFAVMLFVACDRKPFVEQKMQFEKVADGCSTTPQAFKMTSNFGGERYEFDRCLPANFAKEQMTVTRQGDTVVVKFKKPEAAKAIFNIILDIDSYPKYSYISIDEDTYAIVASK
jgi:hypothetical protein